MPLPCDNEFELNMNKIDLFKNKTIVIMGGGTAGWISALYFLNKSKANNLNLEVKLISSNDIGVIGVGEGTTPIFKYFLSDICKITEEEFLRETKGSYKSGIKFSNWNFDKEYYYHLFDNNFLCAEKFLFYQYIINNDINISQKDLQKKLFENNFDLLENNKISDSQLNAYHFSASLVIPFFKKKCLEFEQFCHIEGKINRVNCDKNGYIESLNLEDDLKVFGNFFINSLGFNSKSILHSDFFEIKSWDNFILNDSAFAIQVKNSNLSEIEPYTTSTAEEFGWSWKIPQYEKTGYGYVYSSDFIEDEEKLYDNLITTYNIKETDIFKTRTVKSKPYYNLKQIHKNCLSLGLSSGFIEPLEATSIHMTIFSLNLFFEMIENVDNNEEYLQVFNHKLENHWENIFKFVIFHYFTNNPINDYWKHYKNIKNNKIFDFYEKYQDNFYTFSQANYFSVSLGMKMKDFYYTFTQDKLLSENIDHYFKFNSNINTDNFISTKKSLDIIMNKTF